jgi:putative membrane protein
MRRLSRILLGALVLAQVGYSRLPERRRPPATRAILLLMLATSAAEAAAARGARGVAQLAASGGVGFGAELVGVRTGRPFGPYSYGPLLGRRVGGVPLLAAAAWAVMSRPAWVVAGLLDRRPAARTALAAGALTAWDVFLDPRMVRDGYWTWPGGGSYEGVPLSNFAGWYGTALLVFATRALLDSDDDPREGDGALALYGWTWIGETFATAVIWRRLPVAVAGGAAMGAFALPALVRRLRAL